jgi:hypothetical protein
MEYEHKNAAQNISTGLTHCNDSFFLTTWYGGNLLKMELEVESSSMQYKIVARGIGVGYTGYVACYDANGELYR